MSNGRVRRISAWFGMGTTIGLGATLGIFLGMLMDQIVLGMILSSGAGVALGAGLEQRRRQQGRKE
jgi:hypothetical protein